MAFDSIISQGTFSGETVNTGFQYIIAGSTPENITFSAGGQQPITVAAAPENTIPDVDNNYLAQDKIFTDGIVQDTRTNVDTAAVRNIDNQTATAVLTLPAVSSAAVPASAAGAISAMNVAAGVKASSPESKLEPNITATASDMVFAGTVNISVRSPAWNSTEYNSPAVSVRSVDAEGAAGPVGNYIYNGSVSDSLSVSSALGATANYRVYNTSLRAIDAEKSGVGDTELCWAATASNMLYWAGWGKNTGSLSVAVEDDLLDYYKQYFTDVPGSMDSGIKWFLTGEYDRSGSSGSAQLKKSGGGGFFSSLRLSDYLKVDSRSITAMSSVDSFLKEGDVCGLGIYWSGGGGHAITCWGFSYNSSLAKSNKNYYTGVWISDSDDNYGGGRSAPDIIRYCPVRWSGRDLGYIVTYQPNYYGFLGQVVGLKRTFTIKDYDPVSGETVQGGTQTVFSGGVTYDNIVNSGGSQIVSSGGVTSGTVVNSGGSQFISSGGTANNTAVNSGGSMYIASSGAASGTAVNFGGYQTVSSGGGASNTTVNSGGSMYVSSGGIAGGSLTVAGGHVVLENAASVSSLTALSYVLAVSQLNDVLITVNAGTFGAAGTAYSLSLDNAATGSYILVSGADLSGLTGRDFSVTYNNLNVNVSVGSSYTFSDGNKLTLSVTGSGIAQLTAAFTSDTQPPSAPAGLGRTVTGNSVAFDWADSTDAESSIKQYEIRLDNNANFSSPEYKASPIASGFTISNVTDGTYYWSVRARDDAGNYSAWTPGTGFVVDATAPSAPVGLTRTITGNSVALDWSNANDKTSGVKQYEVQVDNNADFSSPEYTAATSASAATFNGLIENDYFWRVRTQDNSGNYSAWTAGSGFVGDLVGNNINSASPLAAASVTGAVGFGDSADVYKLTMASAGTLTLGLTGLSGNANMFLLNSYGSILKYSMNTGAADEAINNAALQAGTYYIKITPGAGVNGTDYTLTDAISYFDGDTKDLAGNSIAAAKLIDASTQTGWAGLGDKDDYYRFDLAAASQATLRLHDMTGGNANLLLYNSKGWLLQGSVKPGALEDVITANLAAGTYYARVNVFSGNIDYKLDFSRKDGFGMLAG